jgi:hypothetical protein
MLRNASIYSFCRNLSNGLNVVKPFQMIPFPRNEDIIIREDIFRELERKLPVSQHRSAALWGLGGSGYNSSSPEL